MNRKIVTALFVACLLFAFSIPARAQSPNPPAPDPNSAWAGVFEPNGSLNPGLKDGGEITQQANWMPSVLGVSIPATYHVYYTASGNTVVIPNTVTEFFMAANPGESGIDQAASSYGSGAGFLDAILGAVSTNGLLPVLSAAGGALSQTQYVSPDQFAQDLISGQTSIWSLGLQPTEMLFNLLGQTSWNDKQLDLTALMYLPDQCGMAPGGCTAQNLPPPVVPPPAPVNPPPTLCPAPSVIPGAISYGGGKTYPPYPIVVGQDPNQTGVTVEWHASVAPTIYITYQQVPIKSCKPGPNSGGGYNCGGGTGHIETTGYKCVQNTQSFNECIASAYGALSLSQAARDWILNGALQLQFPGAYIHKPYFSFGGGGCAWSAHANAQIDDPGPWDVLIGGNTSGTPVSAPRGFNGNGSPFDVAVKEVVIIK